MDSISSIPYKVNSVLSMLNPSSSPRMVPRSINPRSENDTVRNTTSNLRCNNGVEFLCTRTIYASDGAAEKVETEKAVADEWTAVTRRWKDGVALYTVDFEF
ncbi:hypothetical protein RHSIM_Rhsim04G0103000 [Rhododendron simsii]|uniref:Uncharacterized protein n=1 Tax=Rhododendron simsii TaxID=118357 RepID=A0A834H094_RHOSS|nr:hypothetical protein RHSIM_Rhsim04G0103000 [Rhododendron simsii]